MKKFTFTFFAILLSSISGIALGQPACGVTVTLDLRRLPAGAYILRIHTPQGVATKKLTVRR